jgi:hypothetical protein
MVVGTRQPCPYGVKGVITSLGVKGVKANSFVMIVINVF